MHDCLEIVPSNKIASFQTGNIRTANANRSPAVLLITQ